MMNKEVYLKNVAESLALLSREVSILNAVNLYDINIVAEDFFPGLLNLIYGYELKNANYLEKNAPAIDLVDPKNRIAVQVTSDNSSTKIKHTIEEFNKNKAYQSYDRLIAEYTTLYTIYGEALKIVNETLGIDEAQDIIIMFYLQDISVQFLEEEQDNPIAALNKLVTYFETKLSANGKKYDRSAIKFYLVNEMIKCRVFPNERSEYDAGK